VADLTDFTLHREDDGTITVSSPLTRGRAATIDFLPGGKPFVVWAVNPSYRGGLTESLVLSALAEAAQ
jgi:hypothetical protein